MLGRGWIANNCVKSTEGGLTIWKNQRMADDGTERSDYGLESWDRKTSGKEGDVVVRMDGISELAGGWKGEGYGSIEQA